ncbi:hypothetical protein AB7M71_004111 [Bradyrhizobium japonicum]
MVSTSFMVDTSSHPRAQLHRCVERSAYEWATMIVAFAAVTALTLYGFFKFLDYLAPRL